MQSPAGALTSAWRAGLYNPNPLRHGAVNDPAADGRVCPWCLPCDDIGQRADLPPFRFASAWCMQNTLEFTLIRVLCGQWMLERGVRVWRNFIRNCSIVYMAVLHCHLARLCPCRALVPKPCAPLSLCSFSFGCFAPQTLCHGIEVK